MIRAVPTLTTSERNALAGTLDGETYECLASKLGGTSKSASQAAYRASANSGPRCRTLPERPRAAVPPQCSTTSRAFSNSARWGRTPAAPRRSSRRESGSGCADDRSRGRLSWNWMPEPQCGTRSVEIICECRWRPTTATKSGQIGVVTPITSGLSDNLVAKRSRHPAVSGPSLGRRFDRPGWDEQLYENVRPERSAVARDELGVSPIASPRAVRPGQQYRCLPIRQRRHPATHH